MGYRLLHLPDDLDLLAEVTPACFQYPENSAWGVQSDEAESLVETMHTIKRVWPLIRFGQVFSSSLKDVMQGCLWEEDGRVVGTTLVQRRGTTDKWGISNVGVLPEYRRRGIARKLMQAGIDLVRERGGKKAILDVIDGNVPAYQLYESMGFEHYSGSIEYHLTPGDVPALPGLPEGYTQSEMGQFEWKPRFEMEQRIAPSALMRFEPVEIGRFKPPFFFRLIVPVISALQQIHEKDFGIHDASGMLVARAGYSVPKKEKGVSNLYLRVDPAHAPLADYLASFLLHHVLTLNPRLRVESSTVNWLPHVASALEKVGFTRRMEYCRMGLELE